MSHFVFFHMKSIVVFPTMDGQSAELVGYFRHLFDAGNVGVDARDIEQPVFVFPDSSHRV